MLRLEDLAQVEVQALNGVLENQKTSGCIVVVLIVIEIISGLSTTRRSKLDLPVFLLLEGWHWVNAQRRMSCD